MPIYHLGQRLSISNHLCTVRYIGPVHGTPGEWLGVEWDEPEKGRGKHAGEHDGRRYFACLNSHSHSASFIRPHRPTDAPRSFLAGVHAKYSSDGASASSSKLPAISIGGKVVEEVGFEKIRQQLAVTAELRIVLVDGLRIAGVLFLPCVDDGPENAAWMEELCAMAAACPRITELDLSRNLLERLVDVAGICGAMPALTSLKLNGNRLYDLNVNSAPPGFVEASFSSIRELHLDSTLLAWQQITSLTALFPRLTSLSLESNQLANVPRSLQTADLTSLSLAHNAINAMACLEPLAHLPNLTTLILAHNHLSSLVPSPTFSHITMLSLAHNRIPSLSHLSHLATSFPSLVSLLTTSNPLHATLDPTAIYTLTLARLPTLHSLNHTRITPADRLNADLYYLSQIARELAAAPTAADEPALLAAHPRYAALCAQYGAPTIVRAPAAEHGDGEPLALGPMALVNRLVKLQLRFVDAAVGEVQEREMRVPRSVSVYRLKGLVGQAFGRKPLRLRLMWETGEWDPLGGKGEEADRWSVGSEDDEQEQEEEEEEEEEEGEHKNENEKHDEQKQEEDRKRKWKKMTETVEKAPQEDQKEERNEDSKTKADSMPLPAKNGLDVHGGGGGGGGSGGKGWIRREVELVDGTREVGFWIEGQEASVRVHERRGFEEPAVALRGEG